MLAPDLLHPVAYTERRGARLYETFLDRGRWLEFMRAGRACARAKLARMGATAANAATELRA